MIKTSFCPMNAELGLLALGWPSLRRFSPSASPAFPGSQRGGLPVSSLSGQNVGPEVGWVERSSGLVPSQTGWEPTQKLMKETWGSKESSRNTGKGRSENPDGLPVVSEKINLKKCCRLKEASLFSRPGWAAGESRELGFGTRQTQVPITILSLTPQIPTLPLPASISSSER